jgi:hypothetical protein
MTMAMSSSSGQVLARWRLPLLLPRPPLLLLLLSSSLKQIGLETNKRLLLLLLLLFLFAAVTTVRLGLRLPARMLPMLLPPVARFALLASVIPASVPPALDAVLLKPTVASDTSGFADE